jgi:hypothetical protein
MALSEKDRQGITIIVVVVVAVVGLLLASQLLKPPARNANGCLPSGWPTSTVILLDHSEGVSTQTGREIETRVVDFINKSVPTNGHVSLYTVSEQSAHALIPVFDGCKPPSSGNRFTQSERSIRLHFNRDFMGKLKAALGQQFSDSTTSPIAQAVSDLSESKDLRAERSDLLVFSDMIENSPQLDMYHCSDATNPVQQYRAANAGAVERPTFKNVAIVLNMIPRRGLSQATLQCRKKFWPWFFGDDAGPGASLNSNYLPG